MKWCGVGVGRKRTSPRTEKLEESSGELAHGTACCQGKWRMRSQKICLLFQHCLPPYIYSQAASLALKGCGVGNRGSRSKMIYDLLSYSTWKQNQAISCAWNWPSLIWYYSTLPFPPPPPPSMNCLWSFIILLGKDFIDLWSSYWHRSNVECRSPPILVSVQKCRSKEVLVADSLVDLLLKALCFPFPMLLLK